MSRSLRCGMSFCGESFAVTIHNIPDEYFDARGLPLWHKINNRFSAHPQIVWDRPIGPIPVDEKIVETKTGLPPIGEELQKLREVVATLEKKVNG